ncbi:sugar ABC transporter permease [Clostridia bacterium]|nr:sugar ABC transporter permease [Clostridia bacterium]
MVTTTPTAQRKLAHRLDGFVREMRRNKYLYLLAVPGAVFIIVFSYIPMSGHLIAFKSLQWSKGILFSPWVGFDNFRFLFMNPDWLRVTVNTLYLNALFMVFALSFALLIALLLNELRSLAFKRVSQSLIFLPYFISWMVVSFMIFTIFNSNNGIANSLLTSVGRESVSWYNEPSVWPAILIVMYVWKIAGYYSVIMLSAITGISGELYESARIDGATRLQQALYITVPLIRRTVIILALLAIGRIFFGDFGMFYSIIGDNAILYPTTDVIDTFAYRALRKLGNFGMASSVSLYQSALGLITVVGFNALVRRVEEGAELF